MRIDWTKRVGGLGAVALAGLAVIIGPMAGIAQAATTTTVAGGSTTTTLPPQKSIFGSVVDNNSCQSVLVLTSTEAPTPAIIGVKLESDAFPQPHEGDPIKLTNTSLTLTIPATLLQEGVDAGIINDGDVIPSTTTVVIDGSGTTEKSHTYTFDANSTIAVEGGVAQPLSQTQSLPNTTWHPVNKNTSVYFSEKSVKVVATIDLSSTIGVIATATFTCKPHGSGEFLALGGLGEPSTTTSTTSPATTTTLLPTTTAAPVVSPASGTGLPVTGSNTGVLAALGVGCLSAGLFALRASRGRRTRGMRARH